MPRPRNLVRLLVGATLIVALAACAVLTVPENLPAIALKQAVLYRLEVALGIFYGCRDGRAERNHDQGTEADH